MDNVDQLMRAWENSSDIFLLEKERNLTYGDFYQNLQTARRHFRLHFPQPSCLVLQAENSSRSFTNFIAALAEGHSVLLCPSYQFNDLSYRSLLRAETRTDFHFVDLDRAVSPASGERRHPLIENLQTKKKSAFLVRTSGSSGQGYKFILHDPELFIAKYRRRGRHFQRTLAFSPAEAIAGIETLLETLVLGGSLAAAGDRLTPQTVSDLISQNQVDYLQTTPTFLNLMVMAKKTDPLTLKSLKKIAYGSEPSSAVTLQTLRRDLPFAELNHTYGMSEIGIQITHTNPEDPSVFYLDELNPGRIRQEMIEVKSLTPLIGYLNAEAPLEDGWFQTFDRVQSEGIYWRVLGRQGDLINMAGRKFFPSDVESLLMEMPEIGDVTVIAEKNEMIGHSLTAKIILKNPEEESGFRKKLKLFCESRVPFFMHPHKIIISAQDSMGSRFKKMRRL